MSKFFCVLFRVQGCKFQVPGVPGSSEPETCNLKPTSVRMKGLEPPRLSAPDPKSGAAANYATSAYNYIQFWSWEKGTRSEVCPDGIGMPITPYPPFYAFFPLPNSFPKGHRFHWKKASISLNSAKWSANLGINQ
jgi:hypothetical protein